MAQKKIPELEEEQDFYNEEEIENLLEDDEIDSWEAGYMLGYIGQE